MRTRDIVAVLAFLALFCIFEAMDAKDAQAEHDRYCELVTADQLPDYLHECHSPKIVPH